MNGRKIILNVAAVAAGISVAIAAVRFGHVWGGAALMIAILAAVLLRGPSD